MIDVLYRCWLLRGRASLDGATRPVACHCGRHASGRLAAAGSAMNVAKFRWRFLLRCGKWLRHHRNQPGAAIGVFAVA
jgi:hypothetical protein